MPGCNGIDTLHGVADYDIMFGDAGNDTLWGGTGLDTLWGGLNTDTFAFADGDTSADAALCDRIIDFAQAQGDRLDLSAMDANTLAGGDQAFAFIGASAFAGTGAASAGELRYTFVGAYTFVQGDTDGNGTADFMIRLDGNIAFNGVDVIL